MKGRPKVTHEEIIAAVREYYEIYEETGYRKYHERAKYHGWPAYSTIHKRVGGFGNALYLAGLASANFIIKRACKQKEEMCRSCPEQFQCRKGENMINDCYELALESGYFTSKNSDNGVDLCKV